MDVIEHCEDEEMLCEIRKNDFFFQVLNDIDEEIASIEKELIEEGYVIQEVSYMHRKGKMCPMIFAKKLGKE